MLTEVPQGTHSVVALVNGPQSPFELAIASEVFGTARPDLPARYRFSLCAARPGLVDTLAGYPIGVSAGLSALDRADTVVIPGWEPAGGDVPEAVLEALVRAHARGARLLSICSGAFVLAQTGLLDGRTATTHWRFTERLAERFPQVRVEHDTLYIDHGDIATSAGTAAGIDLCLHVVAADQGASYATRVARHMVMPPRREGGQRQYADPGVQPVLAGSLSGLLEWAVERLDMPLDLAALADRTHMSPRTLARRFEEQLGVSPGRWLLRRRLDRARELLETTDMTVDAVAGKTGLSTATNLRRRFLDAFGTTPSAYRRTFRERDSHSLPRGADRSEPAA